MQRILNLALAAIVTLSMSSGVANCFAGKGSKGGGGTPKGTSYQIVQLDDANGQHANGWAQGVNSSRQVVGQVDAAAPAVGKVAACWNVLMVNGNPQSTLSLLQGGGAAYGINDAGEIVGSGAQLALYWSGPTAAPIILPPLPGADFSTALAINNDGVICGRSGVAGAGWQSDRAVVWRIHYVNGSPVVAGPLELPGPINGSSAFALNDSGGTGVVEVVGQFAQPLEAVVWTVQLLGDGSLTSSPLPELLDADANATGVNNSGIVCGQRGSLAVLWSGSTTTTLQRPTSGKNRVPWTTAFDISNTGVIVGRGGPGLIDARAVVWQNSGSAMTYLDSFLPDGSPLGGLSSAEAVNDVGEIVGQGWNGAFIAIPK